MTTERELTFGDSVRVASDKRAEESASLRRVAIAVVTVKIIEAEKSKLRDGSADEKAKSYELLEYLLLESLKMLHPFMPFITEEIYQIFRPGKMLMVERW